jgi:choloylglycine hydrolase
MRVQQRVRWIAGAVALAAAVGLFERPARACTTFCLDDAGSPIFGKNYDYDFDDGFLVVNKRGLAKTALAESGPASWTSRYGSVTFNQYGRELPCGGMNERGLVVELMWSEESRYPEADERGALPNLQWIQYQLDNCATVEEVVATDATVRIEASATVKIHFLVADAKGDAAAIEAIDGKMVALRGEELPFRALANDTYSASLAYLTRLDPVGAPKSASSLDRFARAARRASRFDGGGDGSKGDGVREAFAILDDVAQGEATCWSIVYEIARGRVNFRTRAHREVRYVDLAALDFRCGSPVLVIDLNGPAVGDIAPQLVAYTLEANRELVRGSFAKTEFLSAVPPELIEQIARYPESMACAP